ncbi:MAG: TlpA family protein disulfide reductase [Spirochaetaceae bacterium]|nr:TlpA family protein disulfide reductase [Spirochaetaceae bacterium]
MKKIIFVALISFFAFFLILLTQCKPQRADTRVGNETAPACALRALHDAGFMVLNQPVEANDFTALLLDSGNVTLSSYKGMAVILTFWTTWCEICQDEMPSREIFYQRFKNHGLEILAVNLEEDADTVRQYIHANSFTFPVLLDVYGDVKAGYEVVGYPTNFILNQEGKIIAMHIGYLNWNAPEVIIAFNVLLGVMPETEGAAIAQEPGGSQQLSDAKRFASEYPMLGSDNIFVSRTVSQSADILANGTGVVIFSFPECPWCQYYLVYLQEVVREMGIEKIFYSNIRQERQEHTESYQRVLNILAGTLQYDEEGRPRVYVPDLTIVNRGRIITRDFVAMVDRPGYRPREFLNEERVTAIKNRLREGMNQISKCCDAC